MMVEWTKKPTVFVGKEVAAFTISTKKEADFYGRSIATVDVKVSDELLTERDGSPDTLAREINKRHYPATEAEAHANLIAAAPALLAACENYISHLKMHENSTHAKANMFCTECPEFTKAIEAAIKQANAGTTQNKDAQDSSG